ncbi:serine/threonine-protein kinase [Sorangium sp. So ce1036]|uniref:serine/threonine-protein kinase n=1 Tax=Sorangium sp. So ce1036 TaxID=3133328 RepID=UPI003F12BD7B
MDDEQETKSMFLLDQPPLGGDLPGGAQVGDYVIDVLLASGGCGAVYGARHRHTGDRVALKVLHRGLAASPKIVKRFLREVEVVRLLKHPGIVEIFAAGELEDGRPFYVMEYLEGVTLDVLTRQEGRLSPEEALKLLEPVCSALEAAHHAGIVHRDVKGSNVFVTKKVPRAVKLLDFGVAKMLGSAETAMGFTTAGRTLGTPSIMAPEQILGGPIDMRVDVYALGVLLHRMLTGALPFHSPDAAELARQHLEEPPPKPSRRIPLSPAIDAVVLRCLEKLPEHRYPSVASFLHELREAVGEAASGRDTLPGLTVNAIAIHVELRARIDEDDFDDELADELGGTLDFAERRMRQAGLILVSTTGSEILAMRLLWGDATETLAAREEVMTVASALQMDLARRTCLSARFHANVCLHTAPVAVRSMLDPEILGGALARVGEWAPIEDVGGLCATPDALAGIDGLDTEPGPSGLLMIRQGAAPVPRERTLQSELA